VSFPRDVLLELMAYADGELDDDERARIEALLAENDEARAVVDAVHPLGDFVRASANAHAPSDMASAVMTRIDADSANASQPTTRERNVVDLDRTRARKSARTRAMSVVAAITAVAAGYAVLARPAPPAAEKSVTASIAVKGAERPGSPEAVADGRGVEVEHVDAPNNDVSVIYVPAVASPDVNASSVVIWINDDKGAGGL
jgi:negative regulator of sigma E activity